MKKLKIILFLLFTFVIYCLTSASNDVIINNKSSATNCDYSDAKNNSFPLINSRVLRLSICYSTLNYKQDYENYFESTNVNKIYTIFSLQLFNQNNHYIKNCLIRNRKSDLIFPFHYYW